MLSVSGQIGEIEDALGIPSVNVVVLAIVCQSGVRHSQVRGHVIVPMFAAGGLACSFPSMVVAETLVIKGWNADISASWYARGVKVTLTVWQFRPVL